MSQQFGDLVPAAVACVRDACAGLLGDTDASPRAFADVAPRGTPAPWAVVVEAGESCEFSSQGPGDAGPVEVDRGSLQLSVFAPTKGQARAIGEAAESALADAPLVFDGGTLLEIRPASRAFPPEPDEGPGTPALFHRVITFEYAIQRS